MRLRIGMDDTDSARGMCTTYLAHMIIGGLIKRKCVFLDYPRLVRLNPNVPYKTRGNGAVALDVRTDDPAGARRFVEHMVGRHSDMQNGANPGVAFLEGDATPGGLAGFAADALCKMVDMDRALQLAAGTGIDVVRYGNGRGVVGAMAAIGYEFGDCTAEMLAYRLPGNVGTMRQIDGDSVRRMQDATYPGTFNSYDARNGRALIAPRGPDPVFYGIRGENLSVLHEASGMIRHAERLAGYAVFRTNQGTGDHLAHAIDASSPKIYSSGTASGVVQNVSKVLRGGHVRLDIMYGGENLTCWAYRPTGLAGVVCGLAPGDVVDVAGGVRAGRTPTLSLERVRVQSLAPRMVYRPPRCDKCDKNMKSRGHSQGYGCVRCGAGASGPVVIRQSPSISCGEYLPYVSAERHLARPAQRRERHNTMRFSPDMPWYEEYSGE